MEQRKHPRVQLPLLVELHHPSLPEGKLRCVARDVSRGGVYVHFDQPPTLIPGAKLRLKLMNPSQVESQPTPTVEMVVARTEPTGLGLAFVNATSQHLWTSVERLRDELAIGRDYFQVFQGAVVVNDLDQLLLVQQHGKWGFPGEYLVVGEDAETALKAMLTRRFDLADLNVDHVLKVGSGSSIDLPEAAVFQVYHRVTTSTSEISSTATETYRKVRWVENRRSVAQMAFVSKDLRELANAALLWAAERRRAGAPVRG